MTNKRKILAHRFNKQYTGTRLSSIKLLYYDLTHTISSAFLLPLYNLIKINNSVEETIAYIYRSIACVVAQCSIKPELSFYILGKELNLQKLQGIIYKYKIIINRNNMYKLITNVLIMVSFVYILWTWQHLVMSNCNLETKLRDYFHCGLTVIFTLSSPETSNRFIVLSPW